MRKLIGLAVLITVVTGCATIVDNAGAIAAGIGHVVLTAYDIGGATLASERIDEMVAEGELTQEQADRLKAAAVKGVDKLRNALDGGEDVEAIPAE